MRSFLMATVAASALAIGIGFGPAAAFSPVGKTTVDTENVLLIAERGGRDTRAGGKGMRSGRGSMHRGDRNHRGSGFRSGGRDGYGRGGVGFDFFAGPSYGYVSDCNWLRRRAVTTGSSYWWGRYRACL